MGYSSGDKMEVFDKGSFNLLNKIIEEDPEMAAHLARKVEEEKRPSFLRRP